MSANTLISLKNIGKIFCRILNKFTASKEGNMVERNLEMYSERHKLLKAFTGLGMRPSMSLKLIEPMKTMGEEEKEAFAKSLRMKLEAGEYMT